VKFVRTNGDQLVFRLSQREYRLLVQVLKLHPLIPTGHHQLSRTADPAEIEADQRLLEEAMTTLKSSARKELDRFLKDRRRVRLQGNGCELSIPLAQVEWFLQVLNDIRVGSWLQLGCPDEQHGRPVELTRANSKFLVAMELCGLLQSVILQAVDAPDDGPEHGSPA
jgi:hypothetical protein